MMNVVNSLVASKSDAASATSSASGKAARSNGDEGFAKTLNSYGDEQSRDSGNAGATGEDSPATSTQSENGQTATDTGSADNAAASAVDQAAAGQEGLASDPRLAAVATDLPVEDLQIAQDDTVADATPDITSDDADATTDLLADLQAVIPANTKTQGNGVRNISADPSKSDETAADTDTDTDTDVDIPVADAGTDDALTGEMLAILQTAPEAAATQSGSVDGPQQQVEGSGSKVDIDVLAMRATAPMQSQQANSTDSAVTTTATTSDAARTSTVASDTVAAVQDALEQNDDGSVDMSMDMPTVTVTENRRYIGLAPSSNAVSLATAFGSDPDWSAAMDPSARLSNEALYASTGKVVNTLKIELNPNDLGHVTATMRMVGEELNIHLTVESSKAYKQILSDSSSILDSLKANGYSVDQITVSMASGNSSTSSDRGNDAFANGRQSSDMGQAQQQQQQQSGRQGGSYSGSASDVSDPIAGGSSSGGSDESSSQGGAAGRTDALSGHVYL